MRVPKGGLLFNQDVKLDLELMNVRVPTGHLLPAFHKKHPLRYNLNTFVIIV